MNKLLLTTLGILLICSVSAFSINHQISEERIYLKGEIINFSDSIEIKEPVVIQYLNFTMLDWYNYTSMTCLFYPNNTLISDCPLIIEGNNSYWEQERIAESNQIIGLDGGDTVRLSVSFESDNLAPTNDSNFTEENQTENITELPYEGFKLENTTLNYTIFLDTSNMTEFAHRYHTYLSIMIFNDSNEYVTNDEMGNFRLPCQEVGYCLGDEVSVPTFIKFVQERPKPNNQEPYSGSSEVSHGGGSGGGSSVVKKEPMWTIEETNRSVKYLEPPKLDICIVEKEDE